MNKKVEFLVLALIILLAPLLPIGLAQIVPLPIDSPYAAVPGDFAGFFAAPSGLVAPISQEASLAIGFATIIIFCCIMAHLLWRLCGLSVREMIDNDMLLFFEAMIPMTYDFAFTSLLCNFNGKSIPAELQGLVSQCTWLRRCLMWLLHFNCSARKAALVTSLVPCVLVFIILAANANHRKRSAG